MLNVDKVITAEVAKLDLKPWELLVLNVPYEMSKEERAWAHKFLHHLHRGRSAILERGCTLTIVTYPEAK